MGKVFWILNDALGEGDPELGRLLMEKFLYSLARTEAVPDKLVFMNRGVFLTSEGSPVLDDVRLLADKGCAVSTCGTCMDFYGIKDRLAVGAAGNMDGSAATMATADDVVVLR